MLTLDLMKNDDVPLPSGYGIVMYAPIKEDMTPLVYANSSTAHVRAGSASTREDRITGYITDTAANTARIESDGLLMEPPSTNYALHSNDFENAAWTDPAGNITITPAAQICVDGLLSASKIECDIGSFPYAYLEQDIGIVPKRFSIWAKRGNRDSLAVACSDQITFVQLTDQWQRVYCAGLNTDSDTTVKIGFAIEGDEEEIVAGTYAYIAFAQAETLFYDADTTYIPTTIAAVGRTAEVSTFHTDNIHAATGNWAVALNVKFDRFDDADPNNNIFFRSESGISRLLYCNGSGELGVNVGSSFVYAGQLILGEWHRVVLTGNGTNYRAFLDGDEVIPATAHGAGAGAVTNFQIGAGRNHMFHLKNVRTYSHYASSSDAIYL